MEILAELQRKGVTVARLCADSRHVAPGDVFVALPGVRTDGRAHIDEAIARGAAAVVADAAPGPRLPLAPAVPLVAAENLSQFTGELAHLVYGRPSQKLWMVGVTGTNGKTSITQWIAQALGTLGSPTAIVGTLGAGFPGRLEAGANTTPDAIALQGALARLVAQGAAACAMEVSSIGIEAGRVNAVAFDVAVFTNLTRDHLDYHGTMEAYGAAKARLFDTPGLQAAVLNVDDAFGRQMARRLAGRLPVYGVSTEGRCMGDRSFAPTDLRFDGASIRFTLESVPFHVPVVGRFNAANALTVAAVLAARGCSLQDIARALATLTPPPGRMETLGGEGCPLVVVDYAHTPDALEKALGALAEMAIARQGRLLCVFGCGGERDAGKRPIMGGIADRLADRVWATSDNPRREDPEAILAQVMAGAGGKTTAILDRGAAIAAALAEAYPRDVVLIAGKGHENYQEVGTTRHPFSDRAQAGRCLMKRWPDAGVRS